MVSDSVRWEDNVSLLCWNAFWCHITYVFIVTIGRSVVVGLAQDEYTVNEGDQITVCTQVMAGSISQPLVITIQTGHSIQSEE